jgi:CheY-like chemotaxis protein
VTSRLLTTHMLRREGFSIHETGNAEEALALWRRGD